MLCDDNNNDWDNDDPFDRLKFYRGLFRRYNFPKDYDDKHLFTFYKDWLEKLYENPTKTKFLSLRVAIRYGYKHYVELMFLLRRLEKLPGFQFYYAIPVMSEPIYIFDEPLFEYYDVLVYCRSNKIKLDCDELMSKVHELLNLPDPARLTPPPFSDYECCCNDVNLDPVIIRLCFLPARNLISLNYHIIGFSKNSLQRKVQKPTLEFFNFLKSYLSFFEISLDFKVIYHKDY